MKLLLEYLLSKNKKQAKYSKLESWEKTKGIEYIPADIIHKYILDALEVTKLTAEDVLSDFEVKDGKHKNFRDKSQYKIYLKFEASLIDILAYSPYNKHIGEILDELYENYLPIFDEIINND